MGLCHHGLRRGERALPRLPWKRARIHWSFDDPSRGDGTEEERLGVFRRVRDEIHARLRAWLTAEPGRSAGAVGR